MTAVTSSRPPTGGADDLYDELEKHRPNSEGYPVPALRFAPAPASSIVGSTVGFELEHAIGFSGLRSSAHVVPNTDRYYFVAGGCIVAGKLSDEHEQTFLRGHDDDITAFKLSSSGRYMVSGQRGRNADVCLWDTATHQQLHRFHEHESGILTLDISPDETIVASIGEDRRLAFFDTSNGGLITHTPLALIVPPTDAIYEVVMGPKVLDVKRRETELHHVTVVTSTQVLPYHLNPFEAKLIPQRYNLTSFQRRFLTARYSGDGEFLIIGSEAGDVAVVSTLSGAIAATQRICSVGVRELFMCSTEASGSGDLAQGAQGGSFKYARFGPGSDRTTTFFVGGGDGAIVGCCIPEHSNPRVEIFARAKVDATVVTLSHVTTSRLAHSLLSGTAKGTLQVVQLPTRANPTASGLREEDRTRTISDAVCSAFDVVVPHPVQLEKFLTASQDGILRLWELNSYRILGVFEFSTKEGAQPRCSAIQVCPGLEIMLSSWSDGSVRCHDITNYKLLWVHSRAHRAPVTALVLSPSTKYYVTGSEDGEIKVWDTRSRELKGELKDHRQAIVSLQLFDDDKHLLSGSKDRSLIAWDLSTFRRIVLLETHSGPLTTALLCRNQYNVYTASLDHTMAMWDIRQREPARTVRYCASGRDAYCTTLAKSGDERLLASGGTDQIVQLWDERRFQNVATGYGHSGTISRVAFTADSKQVLSCGLDACAMVWNVYASE